MRPTARIQAKSQEALFFADYSRIVACELKLAIAFGALEVREMMSGGNLRRPLFAAPRAKLYRDQAFSGNCG